MNTHPSFTSTSRKILPYSFKRLPNGKIRISMLTGQIVIVTADEAQRILGHEDLNMQKRKMYQAALQWDQENPKQ